jgi:hypothetical protein
MTYVRGGLIQAVDYNGFVSTGSPNLNEIWSVGSNAIGYGQTALSTVAASDLVEAVSWYDLVNSINNVALHQGTTIATITPPTTNDTITFEADLATNLSNIYTGRLNCSTNGTDITDTGTRTAAWGTAAAAPYVVSTVTVTFGSANEARYFFNTGGAVLVSCSRTGGSVSVPNTTWTTLCNDIGTIGLPAVLTAQTIAAASYVGLTKFGGGGVTPTIYTRFGYYNLTGTPLILFRQFAVTGVYTSDYIQLTYSFVTNVLTISVRFVDSIGDATSIDGNLSVTAVARPSESTYISNSWGTPVVDVTVPTYP